MNSEKSGWERFFGVIAQGQTYLNLIYLLLAFPLGLFYFIFLVTGLSLGVGLFILWIGILILVGMFAAWVGLAYFERWQAIKLLHVDIPPMMHKSTHSMNLWEKFKTYISDSGTWKGLLYLFLKFPMGIVSFVVVVTLISLSGGLILTPVLYPYGYVQFGGWELGSMTEAVGVSLLGMLILFASLHVFNGLAYISGQLARVLLGSSASNVQTQPPAVVPGTPATDQPSVNANASQTETAPTELDDQSMTE
ncbi:MAG: sensor domain-containing protein [Anaerolineaceae bacterium]